jgi:hypothetical protein
MFSHTYGIDELKVQIIWHLEMIHLSSLHIIRYASSEGDWALFIRTATQNPPAFLRAPLVKLLTNGDF